jgi:hypothetical protein
MKAGRKGAGMNEGMGSAGVPPAVFGVPPNTSSPIPIAQGGILHNNRSKTWWGTEGECSAWRPQKIKVNQAKSNQIKVNQAILKHFYFTQKSTLHNPAISPLSLKLSSQTRQVQSKRPCRAEAVAAKAGQTQSSSVKPVWPVKLPDNFICKLLKINNLQRNRAESSQGGIN